MRRVCRVLLLLCAAVDNVRLTDSVEDILRGLRTRTAARSVCHCMRNYFHQGSHVFTFVCLYVCLLTGLLRKTDDQIFVKFCVMVGRKSRDQSISLDVKRSISFYANNSVQIVIDIGDKIKM